MNTDPFAIKERWERHVKRALAYLENAQRGLYVDVEPSKPLVKYMSVPYWNLLEKCVEVATEIVERLPATVFATEQVEDWFNIGVGTHGYNLSDKWLEKAQKLVETLEQRRDTALTRDKLLRRIAAMENTSGRTLEEIELFTAKRALRERHGLVSA